MSYNKNEYRLDDVPSLRDLDRIGGRVEKRRKEARDEQKNQAFVEKFLHEDEIPESARKNSDYDINELSNLHTSLRYTRERRREEALSRVAEDHDNLQQKTVLGNTQGEFKLYSDDEDRIEPPAYLVPRPEGIATVVFDEETPGNWDAEDVYNSAKLHERAEQVTPELLEYRDNGDVMVTNILGSEYGPHAGELEDYRQALQNLEGVHAEPELVSNDASKEEIDRLEKTTHRILSRLNAQTAEISGDPKKVVERTEELIEKEYDEAQPEFPKTDLGYE